MPIFPEGKILPTSGRELGEAKPGVAFIALRAGVPVIPAYICGTPETRQVLLSLISRRRTPGSTSGRRSTSRTCIEDGRVERDSFEEVTRRLMAGIHALRDRAQGRRSGAETGCRAMENENELNAVLAYYPSVARPSNVS